MGPFPKSKNYEYILVVVDYVFKWVEAMPCRAADAKHSKKMFHEIIFPKFGVPRMVISDGGKHFTDRNFYHYYYIKKRTFLKIDRKRSVNFFSH
jgi:hypothetical protein